jgi:ribosomal protein S18 acetylase RimI-like enzyme
MGEAWLADGWLARMYRSFSIALQVCVDGVDDSRLLEPEGVCAAVVPAVPERSVLNSVLYETPEALAAARVQLEEAYAEAGCAWTVWVPAADRDSAALLEAAGHRLDATPRAMVMDLAELPESRPGDLDWDAEALPADVARINDVAYGYEAGTFARGLGELSDTMRLYQARLDGEPASVVGTIDHQGDCSVWWVATLPEARGRGLAGRLQHQALADGRERGCRTTTLQATKLGAPVYTRLGYRDIGELQMWELRR